MIFKYLKCSAVIFLMIGTTVACNNEVDLQLSTDEPKIERTPNVSSIMELMLKAS